MRNIIQSTTESPYHLSVGGVLRNDEGEVAVYYFEQLSHPAFGEARDFYILMRETPEPGETLEQALARGFAEEFGATGTPVSFLGTIVSHFTKHQVTIEKATLYFLCDLRSIDTSKRDTDDLESVSEIRWMQPKVLIPLMKDQRTRIGREDLDESTILERL